MSLSKQKGLSRWNLLNRTDSDYIFIEQGNVTLITGKFYSDNGGHENDNLIASSEGV